MLKIPTIARANKNLAQSEYAKEFLRENGIIAEYLPDISDPLFFDIKYDKSQKENIVLYNPAKGLLFTRKIIYISKGDAAKFYAEDLGEDFVNYLGTNPLKNSIDIYLNPGFVTPEKMKEISDRFNKNSFVFEIFTVPARLFVFGLSASKMFVLPSGFISWPTIGIIAHQ